MNSVAAFSSLVRARRRHPPGDASQADGESSASPGLSTAAQSRQQEQPETPGDDVPGRRTVLWRGDRYGRAVGIASMCIASFLLESSLGPQNMPCLRPTLIEVADVAGEIGEALPYVDHVAKLLKAIAKVVQDNIEVMTACDETTCNLERLKITLNKRTDPRFKLQQDAQLVVDIMKQLDAEVRGRNTKGRVRKLISAGRLITTITDLNKKIDSAIGKLDLAVDVTTVEVAVETREIVGTALLREDPGPLRVEGQYGHRSLLPKEELSFSSGGPPRVIVIYGTGGMGKSTLARALYEERRLLPCFQSKHDAASVSVGADDGVKYVRKELLLQLSDNAMPPDVHKPEALLGALQTPKLLLLDNIWTQEQLTDVRGAKLVDGSLIIVTTRIGSFADGWHAGTVVTSLPMPGLEDADALALFREMSALSQPTPANLRQLEDEIVRSCAGMPLALAVAGGALLNTSAIGDWEAIQMALRSGETIGDDARMDQLLDLSLKGLKDYVKDMFLDACTVMYGRDPQHALCAWQAMHVGRDLRTSLKQLRDRSLLEIRKTEFEDLKYLWVHDVLKAVGGDMARETRVWQATQKAKIGVTAMRLTHKKQIDVAQHDDMRDLQVLLMDDLAGDSPDPVFSAASTQLKWLSLQHCATDHVADVAKFKSLGVLDLSRCSGITSLPDALGDLEELKVLIFCECRSLGSLGESFGNLTALTLLDLSNCRRLASLPESFCNLTALTQLRMQYCFGKVRSDRGARVLVVGHARGALLGVAVARHLGAPLVRWVDGTGVFGHHPAVRVEDRSGSIEPPVD
ncbi:P-loop containing nucleoside triphosphate hydrolase protein [Tribonema minus]|uniref:P-loop containing nucleoside triphosphate hydrolase protein n=1 Tax=Tribonema minus TaxID=303371 RepID=A0A836CBJ0_9STRA|nr:P-loop containing nucleoside triphosphate hydrolase protein [Tribonema minus]